MVEINLYGNNFDGADAAFSVSPIGLGYKGLLNLWFKSFAKIVNLVDKVR